uniref:TGF-beta propeptide domain-containing protein n=1 Tax=Terrapene triunguis TaxID=2587831 RepID=A0A674J2B9_9SAUR
MSVRRSPLFLCALALAVALAPGEVVETGAGGGQPPPGPEAEEPGCPVCLWRKHSKEMRLESIKSQILSKLRLKEAPNITREVVNQLLPKAPPLQQLLDLHDFQGDAFPQDEYLEEDEYHATTETVISMASHPEVSGEQPLCEIPRLLAPAGPFAAASQRRGVNRPQD